ncbi:MAG: putative L-asparaginase [Candidatus Anoxychlamydiales bacterium]|nr:putative L-asparaginase [Candidatus Anoxychlamydiales bacterium]
MFIKKIFVIIIIFSSITLFAKSQDLKTQLIGNNSKLPTVAIITTGGTISEVNDPKTGSSIPGSLDNTIKSMQDILSLANIKLIEFSNIDSSQMTPAIWANLSKVVDNTLEDRNIIGAVITHGTDTMAEVAYFLDLTLKTKKPVVLTGAMRNSSNPYSDGPLNLRSAVIQVISNPPKNWGVTVSLNQYINAAREVVKTNTTNPQTFESGPKGYLGYIFEKNIYPINLVLYHNKFPIPKKFPKVFIYQDYAGATSQVLKFMADQTPDAIVVEGLGAGNVNSEVFEGIKYAIDKNIIVAITSTVPHGGIFPIYGDVGGGDSLKKAGVIFSVFLRADKTRLLLLLAIAKEGKNKEKLSNYLQNP